MIPAEDFRRMVLAAVHDIRVDPFDQLLKDQLADLLEEHGRPGATRYTIPSLRDGICICNSLDIMAAKSLVNFLGVMCRNYVILANTFGRIVFNNEFELGPEQYRSLWVYIYANQCLRAILYKPVMYHDIEFVPPAKLVEVVTESEAVWSDRREKDLLGKDATNLQHYRLDPNDKPLDDDGEVYDPLNEPLEDYSQ